MPDEQLKCNICGVTISASEAKEHTVSSSHESHRAELEQRLREIRTEYYEEDISIVHQWKSST
ncbi:MAG TPA: hypothetical protein VF172_11375 [Nitrososphaera sp.]